MPVAAVLVAIAVDEALDLLVDLHPLHLIVGGRRVVGVDEVEHRSAFELLDLVAQHLLPSLVHLEEPEIHVADHQEVQGDLEEGGQVPSGVLLDLLRFGGLGPAAGQLLLGPMAGDGDAAQLGGRFHEADAVCVRPADAAAVDGEGAEHLALLAPDRLRPTGAEARPFHEMLDRRPTWVGLDVLDHHALVPVGGHRTGADVRTDRRVDHVLAIVGRQARRRRQGQHPGGLIQQIDAAGDVGVFLLDRLDDRLQHILQRGADS